MDRISAMLDTKTLLPAISAPAQKFAQYASDSRIAQQSFGEKAENCWFSGQIDYICED